jgi:hypothetical protein
MGQMHCDLHFAWALLARFAFPWSSAFYIHQAWSLLCCWHTFSLQDINLSTERLTSNKAFTNKLWNAGKFLLQNLPDRSDATAWDLLLANKVCHWIFKLHRMHSLNFILLYVTVPTMYLFFSLTQKHRFSNYHCQNAGWWVQYFLELLVFNEFW